MLLLPIYAPVFRRKHRGNTAHNLLRTLVDIFACNLCASWFEGDWRAKSYGYTWAELFQCMFAAPDSYRHYRDARSQRNHAQSCMAFCQGMSLAARALGKYEENLAFLQLFVGGTDGLAVALSTFDRECTHETHHPANIAVKGLLLGHRNHFVGEIGGNKRHVGPREVIGGDDKRS